MSSRDQNRFKAKRKAEEAKTTTAEKRRRHPLIYAFSVAILVIVIITFIGGPLLGRLGEGGAIVFGRYGKKDIEFVPGNYLSRQRDYLYDQLGTSASSESYEWQAYRVWKGAYDNTVLHTAILLDGGSAGLHVSDNRIDEMLLTSGPYMVDGAFNEERYKNTPSSERFRYRGLYREELLHQQYLQDIFRNGVTSSKEAVFLKGMASEERSFEYVLFSYSDFPDEQVAEYGEEYRHLFRKIKLSRITIKSSLAETQAIRRQITDNAATFEDQAKNYSNDAFSEKGGDMGWRTYHSLSADFTDAGNLDSLFGLPQDDISQIYDTSFGWIFFKIDSPSVDADLSDIETLESVRSYMTRFERGKIEDYIISIAEEFKSSAQESGFQDAASANSFAVYNTESFPINYGNTFFMGEIKSTDETQDLSGAVNNEAFFLELFSIEEGQVSNPLILNDTVGVFSMLEARAVSEEDLSFLEDYYPYIVQQYNEQDFQNFVFVSDMLEDNFTKVFSEIFLTQ